MSIEKLQGALITLLPFPKCLYHEILCKENHLTMLMIKQVYRYCFTRMDCIHSTSVSEKYRFCKAI